MTTINKINPPIVILPIPGPDGTGPNTPIILPIESPANGNPGIVPPWLQHYIERHGPSLN